RHARAQKRDESLTIQSDPSLLAETVLADPDPSLAEATDIADEIEHIVRQRVEGLDEAEKERVRTIIGMRLKGYTPEEIATQVGCSAKTVQRHLEAFREALRERLEAEP